MDSVEAAGQPAPLLRIELVRTPAGRLFRFRPVPVAVGVTAARTWAGAPAHGKPVPSRNGPGNGQVAWDMQVTLAGRVLRVPDDGSQHMVSGLCLLRTLFEDHYVDPDHDGCLFFSGKTLASGSAQYDFSVTHRGDAVLLSDFSWRPDLASQTMSLTVYAQMVVAFARSALATASTLTTGGSDLNRRLLEWDLGQLLDLAEQFVSGGCRGRRAFAARFHDLHGHRKQPLQLQVTTTQRRPDRNPDWEAGVWVRFGPIRRSQLQPMRLNGGPVVLVETLDFHPDGVQVAVHGAGDQTLQPGDQLTGLQFFYS